MTNRLAVIGGTILERIEDLEILSKESIITPFGRPSDDITIAKIDDVELLFLARHGKGHNLLPSEVNYRANIYALKQLGATWCLSVSAVGSLAEEIAPGDLVLPDQFIDRTNGREQSFFGDGLVAHVAFADPVCPVLAKCAADAATKIDDAKVHKGGTYVCINGPSFSTRAESHLFRSWNASIIGMTNLPEARLAREAEIAYATLALVTDYDCWKDDREPVDTKTVIQFLSQLGQKAQKVLEPLALSLKDKTPSDMAAKALDSAFICDPREIDSQIKERLNPILARVLNN